MTGEPRWADVMSEEEEEEDDAEEEDASDDMGDHLLRYFPVPGEIWVHIRSGCNYLSSLLCLYTPPEDGTAPFIINGWRTTQEVSPFRVTYGIHNPAMRGLVVTPQHIIPNFSWTPRLVLDADQMAAALSCPMPPDLLVLPAVNTDVMRVFHDGQRWYVASNQQVEEVGPMRPLVNYFNRCLKPHYKKGLAHFVSDLRTDRVWFFALYAGPPPHLLYLGTCAVLTHAALPVDQGTPFAEPTRFPAVDPRQECPDLDFSLHKFLAPSIPILAEFADVRDELLQGPLHDPEALAYTGQYDGVLLVNPVTMFAARLCQPELVFLAPVLRGRLAVVDFLATQVVHAHLMDASRVHVDRVSHRWWKEDVEEMTHRLFGGQHGELLSRIRWQVDSIPQWIAAWMGYVSSLCWDEWQELDVDLQRLYVLLDYVYDEDGGAWCRVLRNPKYVNWVAKAVVFSLQQQQQ